MKLSHGTQLLMSLVLLVLGSGCDRPGPTPSTVATSSSATAVSASVPQTTSVPSASAPAVEPPETLPVGLPAPPEGVALPVSGEDPSLAARWSTPRDGQEVYGYYLDALPGAGFGVTGAYPGGTAAVITVDAPDGSPWAISLSGRDPLIVEVRRAD